MGAHACSWAARGLAAGTLAGQTAATPASPGCAPGPSPAPGTGTSMLAPLSMGSLYLRTWAERRQVEYRQCGDTLAR